jgi:hypothetical protein
VEHRFGLGLLLLATLAGGCDPSSGSSSPANGGNPGAGSGGAGSQASARFFLPTGEPTNTAAPSIEVDKQGGIHAVYPAFINGNAFYAYCPASCSGPDQMKVVELKTDGTVHNAMLALDSEGRPRVLLSSALKVYYSAPTGDFTDPGSWTLSVIIDHNGEREVTGEAFALDPRGRPRFIMHTYKAYLGVGQKPPQAFYVACDDGCTTPAAWKVSKIADQMWRSSSLRFDANGVAKLATVVTMGASETSSGTPTGAYVECAASCESEASWKGIGLAPTYESELEAVRVTPAISLALTKSGAPRVLLLGQTDLGKKNLTYLQCDSNCTGEGWTGSRLSDHPKLGAGLDLVLDANDHPRFVHTLDYNIALAYCDQDNCAAEDAKWELSKVEYGGEMKPDEIFLYENCNVSAWFLHSPSIALTPDGRPRVGYQARDISGGWSNPDKTKPACVAGTDMTWSRLAIMPSVASK